MDVCSLEEELITRFVWGRSTATQPSVMGRLGGERPGLSSRSLVVFPLPAKAKQGLKKHFHHPVKRKIALLVQKHLLRGTVASHHSFVLQRETQISKQQQPLLPVDTACFLEYKWQHLWIFLTQTPLPSSLYFPFDRIHFWMGAWAWMGPVAFSTMLHAWVNATQGMGAKPCSHTNTPNAHWLLHKLLVHIWGQSLAFRWIGFGYFAIPVQKFLLFYLSEEKESIATSQPVAGKRSPADLSTVTFNYWTVLGFSCFTARI